MKKYLLLLMAICCICLIGGCDKEKDPSPSPSPKTYEMIVDNKFENGIIIEAANGTEYMPENRWPFEYRFNYNEAKTGSSWRLAQHYCSYGLADNYASGEAEPTKEDGYYIYRDNSKVLKVNSDTGSIVLELNASEEFSSPRVQYQNWPHMILQEAFSNQVMFNELESLILNMQIKMHKMTNHMTSEEYNPSLHTIQFIMYIYLYSNSSLDSGEFFYFGIPIYDYRHRTMAESGMIEANSTGTNGKFIYQMPTVAYLPTGVDVGEKYDIKINLLDNMSRGLELAQSMGKLTHTTVDDLYITSMNVGFEITGTFDCSIEMSSLSLIATEKE